MDKRFNTLTLPEQLELRRKAVEDVLSHPEWSLAESVRHLKKTMRLTTAEMAKLSGVAYRTMQDIELAAQRGQRPDDEPHFRDARFEARRREDFPRIEHWRCWSERLQRKVSAESIAPSRRPSWQWKRPLHHCRCSGRRSEIEDRRNNPAHESRSPHQASGAGTVIL